MADLRHNHIIRNNPNLRLKAYNPSEDLPRWNNGRVKNRDKYVAESNVCHPLGQHSAKLRGIYLGRIIRTLPLEGS